MNIQVLGQAQEMLHFIFRLAFFCSWKAGSRSQQPPSLASHQQPRHSKQHARDSEAPASPNAPRSLRHLVTATASAKHLAVVSSVSPTSFKVQVAVQLAAAAAASRAPPALPCPRPAVRSAQTCFAAHSPRLIRLEAQDECRSQSSEDLLMATSHSVRSYSERLLPSLLFCSSIFY